MKVKKIVSVLESMAASSLQESWDNTGLILGSPEMDVESAILCLDVTEEVLEEAITSDCHLIISHHPVIFEGLKRINGKNWVERIIQKAIKNDIAIFSMHTSVDQTIPGVSAALASAIGLKHVSVLKRGTKSLKKLVTFVPNSHIEIVQSALFQAGAGNIGNYDSCSYSVAGTGTFRALDNANPYVGKQGEIHYEAEKRIEVVIPQYKVNRVVKALLESHPYEEVAYDIYPLENTDPTIGFGVLGNLSNPLSESDFLKLLKEKINKGIIRHSPLTGRKIFKVALCGGSGSFLINDAIMQGADVFVTGDVTYHKFFDADKQILIADVGHFESEIFILSEIQDYLSKNLTNFAVRISKLNTNPVNYY